MNCWKCGGAGGLNSAWKRHIPLISLCLVSDSAKLVLVVFLLVSITAIFVSPAVDLEPTALRSLQLLNTLFAVLALAGLGAMRLHASIVLATIGGVDDFLTPAPDLIDLNCTRLC